MKKNIISMILVFLLTLFTYGGNVHGGDRELDLVVAGVQRNYSKMKDYKAKFKQEARIKAYPRAQLSKGVTYFKKPLKMRWNYEEPEKQEIVTDGETMWMYTPSLNQVMKADYDATNQSKVAKAFLSGMGNIKEDFDIRWGEPKQISVAYNIVLIPKDMDDSIKSLELSIDNKTFYVIKSVMTDVYGNVTIVSFSEFHLNSGVSDALFKFKVPEGVDVITPPAAP